MNGEIRVVENVSAAFAELVNEVFVNRPDTAVSGNQRFTLALSGGSSATSAYEALAREPLDWTKITVVWGDERCVPLDHPDSNYALAKAALLDKVGPLAAVHPMRCDDGAEVYDKIIRFLLPLDVVHLGVGPDGHTASLFPGAPALDAPADCLAIETGDDLHPHPRMSLTFSAISQSRLAVFTVSGDAKRAVFQRLRQGEDLPAGRVTAERVVWLVDEAAAGSAAQE